MFRGMREKANDWTIPPELEAEMTPAVRAFVEMLLRRIEELESRLRKTPQNSSLPPSSQHPHAKPKPPLKPSGKKPGGQPGHAKCERPLVPADQVTETIPLKPTVCRGCGGRLSGSDPAPLRHQVYELPKIEPLITEYQRHRLACPCCGVTTCAALPGDVPQGQSGPRLVAFTALLMGFFRLSKRRVALFLEEVCHIPCSAGLVVKQQNLATAALRPAYDELLEQLPRQTLLGIDESPTKEANHKAWLWTFVSRNFTAFALRPTRAATVLEELLTDDFRGVVTCDRARMYWRLPWLQWCWSHLQRDFQALVDSGVSSAKRIGTALLEQTRILFRQHARVRDGTISFSGLKTALGKVRRAVERLLLRGLNSRDRRTFELCRELYGYRERLWMFLDIEGLEPTNNASERALRHAVIWRKLSFGTQSACGSRFVETLLSVVETCRQQARSAFDFVTTALERHFQHHPPPSLMPGV